MDENLPLKSRLKRFQFKKKVKWEVIERDYLLSWVLYAIAQDPTIGLVFKGGTALKKCYFGNYRYSEDLDFTAIDPQRMDYEKALHAAAQRAEERLNIYAPCQLTIEKYLEKQPHPERQEAYLIRAKYPWHSMPLTKIYVEISKEEEICCPIEERQIIHEYGEPLDTKIPVYSLEEIILEKLRAILQHTQKIHERSWSRSRARDYYDLWRIFSSFQDEIQTQDFSQLLHRKTSLKQVDFSNVSSFFDEKMVNFVKQTWSQWLGLLVPDLPPSDKVFNELKSRLTKLLEN